MFFAKNPPILLDWSVDSSGSINQRIYRNLWNPLRYLIWALHTFRLKKIERPKKTLLRPQTLDSVGRLSDVNLIHWFSGCSVPKISLVASEITHTWYPLIPRKLQLFQVKETRLQRVVYVRLCHFRMPYGCAGLCQMSQPISGADLRMAPFECHWRSPKPMVFQEPFCTHVPPNFGRRSLARHSELRWRCHECCNLHQATISWVTVIDCGFEQAAWWLSLLSKQLCNYKKWD
jgi:hypothetical protein